MKPLQYIKNAEWPRNKRVLSGLWFIIGIVAALAKLKHHNNFDVYRHTFYHALHGTSLYAESTDGSYWDINHYGPLFSLIIAPFAVLPPWLGLLLWDLCLAAFLYWAVSLLCRNMSRLQVFIVWFCAHELLTALFMQQFNVAIAAIIILSYYFISKEHDAHATFFILVGTFVKIYGIVGIAFFFLSKHKLKFIVSFLGWGVFLFCLPMIISSPNYVIEQYQEWWIDLSSKNSENLMSLAQNISLLGIIRKAGLPVNDLYIILLGVCLMALGYFRLTQWKNEAFWLQILSAILMFVVLFSTGSESSSYIIALIGCVTWYCCVPWKRTKTDIALMVFAFIVTSLSPSDLFPAFIKKNIIQPYALKAMPVAIIWIKLMTELISKDYKGALAKLN